MRLGEFTEEFILEEAQRQYTEGEALIDVDPGRTALIVVDMMDEFVKPQWCPYWVPDATRQVPKILELRAAFHEAKLPVIYTAYDVSLRGLNFPITEWLVPVVTHASEHDVEGILEEVRIYEDLAPVGDDLLILKHCYSGFYGTELDLVLRSLNVSTVVICGTMTNYCCGATAREAFWHGYKVIFGSDVNSTDDPAQQEAELRTLRRGFARIMTADEIASAVRASTSATELVAAAKA
jgi:nicotinamidase-related amidase